VQAEIAGNLIRKEFPDAGRVERNIKTSELATV
jgi:hypothetical protein